MFDWLLQYVLGYCTWLGLAAIGEPPLTKSLPPDCRRIHGQSPQLGTSQDRNELKESMPIWITLIFLALAAGRYTLSFLVSFFSFFCCCEKERKKINIKTLFIKFENFHKDCLCVSSHLYRLDGVICRRHLHSCCRVRTQTSPGRSERKPLLATDSKFTFQKTRTSSKTP